MIGMMKLWVATWHVKSNWIGLPQKNQNLVAHIHQIYCHVSSQNRGDADSYMLFFPAPITNILWISIISLAITPISHPIHTFKL